MVSANAISLASGNLLLGVGILGLVLGIIAKLVVRNFEKSGKSVHRYWKYYGNKAVILGIVLIVIGILRR